MTVTVTLGDPGPVGSDQGSRVSPAPRPSSPQAEAHKQLRSLRLSRCHFQGQLQAAAGSFLRSKVEVQLEIRSDMK